MDIFFLFLSVSLETTWGFIGQTSSCRIWWAGGNSFKIGCMFPEEEFGFRQNLVLVPAPGTRSRAVGTGQGCAPRDPGRPRCEDLPDVSETGSRGPQIRNALAGKESLALPQVAQ